MYSPYCGWLSSSLAAVVAQAGVLAAAIRVVIPAPVVGVVVVVGVVAAAIAAPLLPRGLAATLARLVRLAVIPARLRIAAPSVVAIPVAVAHPVIGDSIMKKYLAMLVTLAVTLFAVNSFAWDPPASPAPASWISDTSGVLTPAAHARLDAKLRLINQSSANEVAALILPTLDGADIADVGDKTAKTNRRLPECVRLGRLIA